MDEELYTSLKKGKPQTIEKLITENLARSWFLCQEITLDSAVAVPLLLSSWERALQTCREASSRPTGDFMEELSREILTGYLNGVEPDGDWGDLPDPQLSPQYKVCRLELRAVSLDRRPVYLTHIIGGVSSRAMAEIIGSSQEEVEALIKRAEKEIIDSHGSMDKTRRAALVRLFTDFKSPQSDAFQTMNVPIRVEEALRHRLKLRQGTRPKTRMGRIPFAKQAEQSHPAAALTAAPRSFRKNRSRIGKSVAAIVIAILVVAVVTLAVQRLGTTAQAVSTTTYQVSAVSYGDVDTTISGSGTLVAILRQLWQAGNTIVLITHDIHVASQAQRRVYVRDGILSAKEVAL